HDPGAVGVGERESVDWLARGTAGDDEESRRGAFLLERQGRAKQRNGRDDQQLRGGAPLVVAESGKSTRRRSTAVCDNDVEAAKITLRRLNSVHDCGQIGGVSDSGSCTNTVGFGNGVGCLVQRRLVATG